MKELTVDSEVDELDDRAAVVDLEVGDVTPVDGLI